MKIAKVLAGLMLIVVAILIAIYVDSGYRPDTMSCGSGMNGYGYCNDEEGWAILYILKGFLVVAVAVAGVLITGSAVKEKTPSVG